MADFTPEDMADKLLADNFSRSGPVAQVASDPLVDTPMVVTLDQLRPYELNPRLTRNANYDDIKASIRERGLDSPPPITRRPAAEHYIIRNGGNTRLAILGELWSETKEERFFRITCLFRPWPQERGEIVALSGHLVESELHTRLTFIERALGVEKMRELYEQELGKTLSQSELARCLAADGFPIPQPHISRMQDAIRYLLPCIPSVLYNGLGRPQVERLTTLRKSAEALWSKQPIETGLTTNFEALFEEVLGLFDTNPDGFAVERVQDELVGQMAKVLGIPYNELELDIENIEQWQQSVNRSGQPRGESTIYHPAPTSTSTPAMDIQRNPVAVPISNSSSDTVATLITPYYQASSTAPESVQPADAQATRPRESRDDNKATRVEDHIVSPAVTTDRLQAIQQLVAEHTGEPQIDFADQALRAIPIQAGGLFPISDVWFIEAGLDSPERLRIHIAQFAREIAAEATLTDRIEAINAGIGFTCAPLSESDHSMGMFAHTVQALLRALSVHYAADPFEETISLNYTLGSLLLGSDQVDPEPMPRLSDNGVVKLYRLVRLARRLLDLEALPDETHS